MIEVMIQKFKVIIRDGEESVTSKRLDLKMKNQIHE